MKTRDSHIARVHRLLEAHDVRWTPSKVATVVKRYLSRRQSESLESFVAKLISRQLATRTIDPKCITYADPTGEDAVHGVLHPSDVKGDDVGKKYGTLKECAEEYGISVTTLRRWIADGRITAHRVGPRLIRLDLDQVRRELFGDKGTAA